MVDALAYWFGIGLLVAAAGGCVYVLFASIAVRRFVGDDAGAPAICPSITVLKPLRGAEADLHGNLASFCHQDYPAPVQVLFGVRDARDPAVAVVERLLAEWPGPDLQLVVVSTGAAGPNPKVATLVGLQGHIRNDVVVLSDSDVLVDANYLTRTVAALA